jgi:hypothetical protein
MLAPFCAVKSPLSQNLTGYPRLMILFLSVT